jgi:glucan 1,3-beta-glucosidase
MTDPTVHEDSGTRTGTRLRGVNLGGWLVLEKWITPSLFQGLQAFDETSYCVELGKAEATRRLHQHWESFITREDFAWLANAGINAVRLPFGHWLFGKDYPYHRCYKGVRYPYAEGGLAIIDRVFQWAREFGLRVVLDLHAAPGCQNGFDNGGLAGVCEWHSHGDNIAYSLEVLERLAHRYATHPAMHGIEVLNEPRWDIPTDLLRRYTTDAYHRIRRHCPPENVTVIFHDGFRSFREYAGFLQEPEYRNVAIDIHRYQCFVKKDIDMDIFGHICKSVQDLRVEADEIIRESGYRVYCGEWSLGLAPKMITLWNEEQYRQTSAGMDEFLLATALRGYGAAQLLSFEKYAGWFFWTYRTEASPDWCYRECVEQGLIPHLGAVAQSSRLGMLLERARRQRP